MLLYFDGITYCLSMQCYAAWYAHVPRLKVLAPYSAEDAWGLLKAATRDLDPIVFLENELLYAISFSVQLYSLCCLFELTSHYIMLFSAVMVNPFLFLTRYLILASAFRLERLRYVLIFISGSEEFNLIRLPLMDFLQIFVILFMKDDFAHKYFQLDQCIIYNACFGFFT